MQVYVKQNLRRILRFNSTKKKNQKERKKLKVKEGICDIPCKIVKFVIDVRLRWTLINTKNDKHVAVAKLNLFITCIQEASDISLINMLMKKMSGLSGNFERSSKKKS